MQLPTSILEIKSKPPKGVQYKVGQEIKNVPYVNIFKKEKKNILRAAFYTPEGIKTASLSKEVEDFAKYWLLEKYWDFLVVPSKIVWGKVYGEHEGFILKECEEIKLANMPYRPFCEWQKASNSASRRVEKVNGQLVIVEEEENQRWILNRMGGEKPFFWNEPIESVTDWYMDVKSIPKWVLMEDLLLKSGCGDGFSQRLYNFVESGANVGLFPKVTENDLDEIVEELFDVALMRSKQ